MKIGMMKHRITIQKLVTVTDKIGNHSNEYQDYCTRWAYANGLSGEEYWQAAQTNAQNSVYFMIRWDEETGKVTSDGYRILFNGKIYNILSVDNYQFLCKTINLKAEEAKR